jgi:glycosyltransferase involved in cell wall biosynthesis
MARATAAGVTIHSSGQYDLSNADLRALYVRAACVVVSHHGSEHPFGITAVAEALAFGRPVVATASPAVDLRVQTIGAGTEVPAHDARALAAAVNALLSDPAGARRLGLAGRLFCAQSCNVQTGADMLAEALAALPGVGRAS